MKLIWSYFKPYRNWLFLSMLLAGGAQVLQLLDPIIFGKIIDEYALNPAGRPTDELVRGALGWLGIAISIALLARILQAFNDYVMRFIVQKFGMEVFNQGLGQTMRLP